jgi:hypothetical protein
MLYQEKKTKDGFEYLNEDLYGWTTIKSKDKLEPDILDQIICEMVMGKKIKKGHTKGLRFEAKFKDQWIENEEKKEEKENKTLKQKIKEFLINIIRKI